jgi:tetratricopeptide (TPR) repeat protein
MEVMMKKHKISTSFILLLFLFLPLSVQAQDAGAILEKYKGSVVFLTSFDEEKAEMDSYSGFLIGVNTIITNYHMVSQAKDIQGMDSNGKKVKIKGILGVNRELDLVLLSAKVKGAPLPLGSFDSVKYGDTIIALGGNESGQVQGYDGKVMQIYDFKLAEKLMDTTLVIPNTLTGGPVFNLSGEVLGIVNLLDAGKKIVFPAKILKSITPDAKETKLKSWTAEDYFETLAGADLAGMALFTVKDTGRAEKYLKLVANQRPDDLDIKIILGSVYTQQRNFNAAVGIFNEILQASPDRDDIQMELADIYFKMRKWPETISAFEKAVQANPQNKKAHYFIGYAYEELKDYQKAAESFARFVESNPDELEDAYTHLGYSYVQVENYDKAADAYKKALEKIPNDDTLNSQLAQLLQKAGRLDEAAEVYYFLAQIKPENANICYNTVIRMYDQANQSDKAIEAAQKLADSKPGDPDALYNVGYMHFKMQQYRQAIDIFKKAIEIKPDFEFAYANLGNCHYMLKQYGSAATYFRKVTELNPGNVDAWLNVAVNLMLQKDFYQAVDPLRKAIDLAPDNGNAYLNLGICYLNMQDNTSARDIYLKLKTIDADKAARLLRLFK